ncbi:MAG: sensor histidine kinase, partial [Paraclostridium sp.]
NSYNINIKDSGIGIDEKGLEKIFGRFEQVRNKKEHYKEGSGIGLSLVKSLVDMHNGKISIKSEVGKGSEITVSIPNMIYTEQNTINNTYLNDIACVNKMNIEFSDIY